MNKNNRLNAEIYIYVKYIISYNDLQFLFEAQRNIVVSSRLRLNLFCFLFMTKDLGVIWKRLEESCGAVTTHKNTEEKMLDKGPDRKASEPPPPIIFNVN